MKILLSEGSCLPISCYNGGSYRTRFFPVVFLRTSGKWTRPPCSRKSAFQFDVFIFVLASGHALCTHFIHSRATASPLQIFRNKQTLRHVSLSLSPTFVSLLLSPRSAYQGVYSLSVILKLGRLANKRVELGRRGMLKQKFYSQPCSARGAIFFFFFFFNIFNVKFFAFYVSRSVFN